MGRNPPPRLERFFGIPGMDRVNINRKSETRGNFGSPKGDENSEIFYQEIYHSQNLRYSPVAGGGSLPSKEGIFWTK